MTRALQAQASWGDPGACSPGKCFKVNASRMAKNTSQSSRHSELFLKEIGNLGGPFPFASFPALFAIHIAVDHVSLLIADNGWIVRPRVTAAIH